MSDKYTTWNGITRAIGSVIGSGILFLPSYTYSIAGGDVLIVWLLTIAICIPGVVFLSDMVGMVSDNSGIGGFIGLGLGKHFGNALPIIMLSTVCLGMPSAALIAGKYASSLASAIGIHSGVIQLIVALVIIWFAIFSNLKDIKANSNISTVLTIILLVVALILFLLTYETAAGSYDKIVPSYDFKNISAGVILAFWAFAGFENLTFMANKFERPRRDLLISSIVAIVTCGLIYILLTANYAAIIGNSGTNNISGLFALSEVVQPKILSVSIITLFAFFAVQINFNSWIEGISGMVQDSAKKSFLPKALEAENENQTPSTAIIAIGIVFTLVTLFGYFHAELFEKFLKTVATNFIYMYLLSIIAYFITFRDVLKRLISFVFILGLFYILASDIKYIIYPAVVTCIAVMISKKVEGGQNA